ncbi:RusA family crossover junction endodeoxyribonuclease [Sinorhizobium meliloti]|uniref:RusA family crossover junction endodeoxyribonuclease n=1 Tax=Rhizobium meliloti TaxID=382 RepID=UPI000B4A105F|nr:RusA family crossover junction endodeoxyribonuclease [Sinorhizobium meliloti]ASQ10211.1 RusA family crossover junction endodeoxyribonuclease [Sinorhizobium meliloti]MQU85678.1 RusA family crossover junction endodeoxyribonuclease [Sinorhizobium meliloti]
MIKLHLPYPPSGWDLYSGWGKTRRLSSTYKKWRTDAGYFIKAPTKAIDKPFALYVALKRQNMRQDLDNRSKAILDALQHYGVIKNDNLCERLTMTWDSDLPAECVVIIQECEEGLAA